MQLRHIRFRPCVVAVFDEVADGTYDLVIQRNESLNDIQPAFGIRGKQKLEKGYRILDLSECHLTLADKWRRRATLTTS